MRTITLDLIRESGHAPIFGIKLENHPRYIAMISPEDIDTWLHGFIAALPPLTED